ncbi:TetR/AcrR family transcriptional regulator [Gordonia sp. zg691]|uniref:TetR/AcrR family transcriptional regulator n=1 Tax=Gordonia jinghuaiqii TaxID=2758710 RepID=A0A7D7LSM9_9ACTN|nr:TetR/AcrR family transcriptional regulator [Gordonia jinghuaiqii]MBD0862484.1 TetR/AcrR family transcriptional regulator [Gordonia jinghuaiqii]MCR5976585.1 TetR family transcriptional regulator [Gordonia jinghuaiqii]QMS99774.1 TetR/AcrR family transcriptional regulator [Gordonia jinghuaiqii]
MSSGEDLTGAARAVARRVGVGALTLAAVAKEAGISRATIYRRYASRDQLISAVLTSELDELERVMLSRLRFADDPRDTIYMLVREVLDYNARNDLVQAALRYDAASLTPWLIRREGHPTLIDIVTDRALAFIKESPVAGYLAPSPEAAVEFMVSAVCAELLSPARFLTHADIATHITDAIYRPSTDGP